MAVDQAHNGHRRRPPANGVVVRPMPHNESAEASILGGIILKNDLLGTELAELEVGDFYDPRHRIVFQAMRNLAAQGRPLDIVTIENAVEQDGKLEAIGGVAFLGELVLRVPTAENVCAYRDAVQLASRNRRAIIELGSALERAYSWPHDASELISEVTGQLSRFEQETKATSEQRLKWCTPIESFLGNEEPDDNDADDWIVRDLIPRGEPVLWGGPMKGGKTWAALDLAIAIARGEPWCGFENTLGPARTLGLFLEDSKRRVLKRVWELCRGRLDPSAGFLSPNDDLVRAHLRISRSSLRIPDPKDVRRFIAEIKAWGARFVVIDNLTRIFVGDPNSTRDAAAFTRAWCDICEETGAAILLLHHTKKVMAGDDKIDPFETLRGSGDFGAAARNIIVVSPIRDDGGPTLAEIRMRGNLDLQRDGFILGFERAEQLGKWRAKLVNKGEIGEVKQDLKKARAEKKQAEKKAEQIVAAKMRREKAIELAKTRGCVSQASLGLEFGMSPRAMAPLLRALCDENILRVDRARGYVLADVAEQQQIGGFE